MHIVSDSRVYYRCYAYHRVEDYMYDSPWIYSWDHSTTDDYFLVGVRQYYGVWIKHFQFGVESNYAIDTTNWNVANSKMCYYDGTSWRYLPGNVCWRTSSAITWIGHSIIFVGSNNYWGVNTGFTSTDYVTWEYTGTTVIDDSQLWSSSGTVSDYLRKPYG